MNLEYQLNLEGMEKLYLAPEELRNEAQNTIVKIDCVGGKVRAYVNAVHAIRPNNITPLGIADTIKLELVRSEVVAFMQTYLTKGLSGKFTEEFIDNLKVTSLETNITLPCVGGATPSDVIHLLDMALDRTIIFRKKKAKCKKVNTGVQYTKPKEYRLKIYDKTDEQHSKGNPLVERNLLRIEIVFIDRKLKRMFGDRRTLRDILRKQAIITMCDEYKRVLAADILEKHVKPFLNDCREQLVESLSMSDSGKEIYDTVVQHKDLIVDTEVDRKSVV